MGSGPIEQRFYYFVLGVAGLVLLDSLLLMPVLVVGFKWPDKLWFALGPYLGFSGVAVLVLVYLLHRWRVLDFRGPWVHGVSRFLRATAVLTGGFIASIVLWPGWVWLALLIYLGALGYAIYRLTQWQVRALAFQCEGCGETFQGSMGTWLWSLNFGDRKYVTCPGCGRATWARIVAATRG